MIRAAVAAILALAAVAAAAGWLADRPGEVAIRWQGWLVETSVARFALVLAVLLALAVAAALLAEAAGRVPRRLRAALRGSRRTRGYRALTQGMVAVAAGDPDEARRQARRADVLLDEPPLTMLLSAQAAQLNGDEAAARRYFSEMLERPETAFLGLRGLLNQARRDGDDAAALAYARRAHELRPRSPWVLGALFDLQVREKNWREALRLLEGPGGRKALAATTPERRAAVLLACGDEAREAGRPSEALRLARRARTLSPGYLPAVLAAVGLLAGAGRTRRAARMIEDAWADSPHPELARIYGEAGPGGELQRVRRCHKLFSINPGHRESRVALAEAALAAGLWGEARGQLEQASGDDPPARICRLMADLEEREHGNTDSARAWLRRAAAAAPDPAWVCGGCGSAWERWRPTCAGCGALGTLDWRPPASVRTLAPAPGGKEDSAADSGGRGAGAPAPGAAA